MAQLKHEADTDTLSIEEIADILDWMMDDYRHLRAHWEYSRSGYGPHSDVSMSNSRYLHVEGGGDRYLKVRVSDHSAPYYCVSGFDLLAGCTESENTATITEIKRKLDLMEPFDEAQHEADLLMEWKAEVNAALAEDSSERLRSEIGEWVELRYEGLSLEDGLADSAKIVLRKIDEDDDERRDTVQKIWEKEIVKQTLAEILASDDGLRWFNSLSLVMYYDNTGLLSSRSEFGNQRAEEELDLRRWVKSYLRMIFGHEVPCDSFSIIEWIYGCFQSAIKNIWVCDLDEELKATIEQHPAI